MARAESDGAWTAVGADKREAVRSLFGDIAGRYDLLNSAMSLRLHHRWRAEAVRMLSLSPGDCVADICCGTGDFAPPIRRDVGPAGMVIGIDFCLPMLRKGLEKAVPMSLSMGDACDLPLASASFDAVTIGWGLRNVADLDKALREIRRILKPRGRFVSADMARPQNPMMRVVSGAFFSTVAPAVGALFGNRNAYKYLPQSTDRFASRENQVAAIRRAGFSDAGYKDMFFGNICIHWGEV
ncbi:MAG: ubiquinone/menaquinone biosynthesis methyltransferase [Armatimonadota bacterium]|nr:ubiquinone/menaquinone biosynthesis methyltransferase [Armatimonadota bacterium]